MFCRSCGENIPVDSVFCPNCGKNLLEIAHSGPPEPEPPAAEEPAAEPRRFRFRAERTEAPDVPEEPEEPEEPPRRALRISPIRFPSQGLSLSRLFWGMGLLFAVVGFIAGIAGDVHASTAWILFGLVLVVAAPHASQLTQKPPAPDEGAETSPEDEQEQEMRD